MALELILQLRDEVLFSELGELGNWGQQQFTPFSRKLLQNLLPVVAALRRVIRKAHRDDSRLSCHPGDRVGQPAMLSDRKGEICYSPRFP